jgi:hypothetical protein
VAYGPFESDLAFEEGKNGGGWVYLTFFSPLPAMRG